MDHLQEAYLSVYEESLADRTRGAIQNNRLEDEQSRTQASIDRMKRQPEVTRGSAALAAKQVESDVKRASSYGPQHPKPGKVGAYRIGEEVDLYDVILSHLLDEGFADNEKNAITIMANMSEAWIDEILDEAKEEEGKSDYEKRGIRNKRFVDNTPGMEGKSPSAVGYLKRQQTHAQNRGKKKG